LESLCGRQNTGLEQRIVRVQNAGMGLWRPNTGLGWPVQWVTNTSLDISRESHPSLGRKRWRTDACSTRRYCADTRGYMG